MGEIKISFDVWKVLTFVLLVLVVINLYWTHSITGKLIATIETTQPSPAQRPSLQPQQQPSGVQVSADDDPVEGPNNAKVTIIEFSDFQCPFCGRFYQQTLPQIEEQYIKTGKIKLVFRDFPLSFHQYAQKASEASECADEQGKFWEYHDKLFENQQALDVASLKQYAIDLGLDTEKFNSCLDNGEMTAEVQKDFQDGQSYGVSGTPTFFINGQKIVGAQPFSTFKRVIDAGLA